MKKVIEFFSIIYEVHALFLFYLYFLRSIIYPIVKTIGGVI